MQILNICFIAMYKLVFFVCMCVAFLHVQKQNWNQTLTRVIKYQNALDFKRLHFIKLNSHKPVEVSVQYISFSFIKQCTSNFDQTLVLNQEIYIINKYNMMQIKQFKVMVLQPLSALLLPKQYLNFVWTF